MMSYTSAWTCLCSSAGRLMRRMSPSTRIIGGRPADRCRSEALFLTEKASSPAISMNPHPRMRPLARIGGNRRHCARHPTAVQVLFQCWRRGLQPAPSIRLAYHGKTGPNRTNPASILAADFEIQRRHGTALRPRSQRDPPAVQLAQAAYDRQSKARTLHRFALATHAAFEQVLGIPGLDAGTGIFHPHPASLHPNDDFAFLGVLAGVADQVAQRDRDHRGRRLHRHLRFDLRAQLDGLATNVGTMGIDYFRDD